MVQVWDLEGGLQTAWAAFGDPAFGNLSQRHRAVASAALLATAEERVGHVRRHACAPLRSAYPHRAPPQADASQKAASQSLEPS